VARQAFADASWGTLREGASADLVWLSADPRTTPALQIPAIGVRATYLRGKLVSPSAR
jgi:predicted amidohydrolase YtcJ